MWKYEYQHKTDVACDDLWPVLADISSWPNIDHNISYIDVTEPPALGTRFTLKPKGGPKLNFTIGDFEPPHTYSDICKMPFATMKTLHRLISREGCTEIRVHITIDGPWAALWGLIVGRKHAAGLAQQTARFIAESRKRAVIAR